MQAQDFLPRAESMIIVSIRVASSTRNRVQISGPDMPDALCHGNGSASRLAG